MEGLITGIVVVVVICVLAYVVMLNGLRKASLKVNEAESGIDVALTKRFDVLTKILDIVKDYKNYEKDVILQSIKLRSGMTMEEKNTVEKEMRKVFGEIKLTAEAYPQLQSSANYKQLQIAVMDTEEHLQAARRAYNASVTVYNTKIVTIPSSIVAGINGFTNKDYFEADAEKRQDVQMKF